MKTKNVKQIESNLPTKAQWLADNADKRGMDLGDGEFNLKKMLASVPENFIAINSESTTGTFEDQAWEALRDFFPTNALFVTTYTKIAKAIRLEKQGIVAYVIGDMTWTVFIAPESLAILLKKSPATDGKSVEGQSVSTKENVMKTTKVVKAQKKVTVEAPKVIDLSKVLSKAPSAQASVDAAMGAVAKRINKAVKKASSEPKVVSKVAPKGKAPKTSADAASAKSGIPASALKRNLGKEVLEAVTAMVGQVQKEEGKGLKARTVRELVVTALLSTDVRLFVADAVCKTIVKASKGKKA